MRRRSFLALVLAAGFIAATPAHAIKVLGDREVAGATVVEFSTTGEVILVNSWAKTIAYNGDNTVNYISITDGTSTWRRTFTYAGGYVTADSGWVKQ